MSQVHGTCAPKFEQARSIFNELLESGAEIGASIAVNIDGEDVVNLWGGTADPETKRPWTEDTIVGVASCSKMVTAIAVLMLVESGAISVTDKVAKYWPEFAANGKEDIEIRHLLSHTSGVAGWDQKFTMDDIADPVATTPLMAAQAPWWEPGTASGYHTWNYGHLLGQIVKKVTGLSLKQFIAEKIAKPLDADFQLGVAEKDLSRVSYFVGSFQGENNGELPPLFEKSVGNPAIPADMGRRPKWLQGEVGAANGYSNAQALNKILRNVTLAGVEGRESLLSKTTTDLIFQEQSMGPDLVLGIPVRFGIGFALKADKGDWVDDWIPKGKIAYWGGAGGSLGIMDVERKITITYAMNKTDPECLIANKASRKYVKAVYEALGVSI